MSRIDGSRVVVTGPTSGIGREIARRLAASGAEVVLACRDAARGELTAREISMSASTDPPAVMVLDTSSQTSIRRFAEEYRRRFPTLDVLVNNAGVLRPEREVGVDGHELTFATNVLGYYAVTCGLLAPLRSSRSARVVNVASTYADDVDLDDLEFERRPYDGMSAYAQSKACDRMLTRAFARRLEPDRVSVNAMAPGLVLDTALYDDLPMTIRRHLEQIPSRTVAEGADTAVWLATSDEVLGATGGFYEQRAEIDCQFRNEEAEERLWALSREMADSTAVPVSVD